MRPRKNKIPVPFIIVTVGPVIILLTVFMIIPMIRSVSLSFQDVGLLSPQGEFVGLNNYAYLFKDSFFKKALVNTVKLMVWIPVITLSISFTLAFLLQQVKLREKNIYILFYFFPYFLSSTVAAAIWAFILHPTSGILNKLLDIFGLSFLKHSWTGEASTALGCIAAVIIWASIGYYIVLYLSALESIPHELYESAMIDGASFRQKFFYITIPLMRNIIGITFVLLMSGVIGASFVYSKLLTGGGPNGASSVLMQYIYSQGMSNGNIGYASAITVVTIALGVLLSFISRKISAKSGDYL